MPFMTKLKVTFIEGTKKVMLDEPLIYMIPDKFPVSALRGLMVIAPIGFPSDLASIPQLLQFGFSKIGTHRRAAVTHDRLYDTAQYSKKIADLIFLYAMKDDNVNRIKRRLMYWAVKYGGTLSWLRHRKRDEGGNE